MESLISMGLKEEDFDLLLAGGYDLDILGSTSPEIEIRDIVSELRAESVHSTMKFVQACSKIEV
jgi:hypothetical protein